MHHRVLDTAERRVTTDGVEPRSPAPWRGIVSDFRLDSGQPARAEMTASENDGQAWSAHGP
jgi:hypothetical protein